jgi:hypothetical protein
MANMDGWIVIHDKRNSPVKGTVCWDYIFACFVCIKNVTIKPTVKLYMGEGCAKKQCAKNVHDGISACLRTSSGSHYILCTTKKLMIFEEVKCRPINPQQV